MARKKLPNGYRVGDRVRISHGGRLYEGLVAESASTSHVLVDGIGNFFRDRVALVNKRGGRAARKAGPTKPAAAPEQ